MKTTQQQQCYAAEAKLDRGGSFDSVKAAQRFVDDLRDTPWWYAQGYHLKVARVEVFATDEPNSSGTYEEGANAGYINLSAHGYCVKTILHEVAHVLAHAVHGSKSHDPWWARTYLTLVSCVMGPDAYLTLRHSFDEQGVDYDVKTATGRAIAL